MISSRIDEILHWVSLAGPWVYLIAFVAAVIEGAAFVGLFFPSETVLLIAGAATIHPNLRLSVLIPLSVTGAVLGDSIGYAIGKKAGPSLRTTRLGRRVSGEAWQRAEDLVHRRGWTAVLLGRFISILRSLVPAVAGALKMRYRNFFLGNFLGAAIWTPLVLVVGHFAAHNLARVEKIITRSGWTLLGFVLLVAAFITFRVWKRRINPTASE